MSLSMNHNIKVVQSNQPKQIRIPVEQPFHRDSYFWGEFW